MEKLKKVSFLLASIFIIGALIAKVARPEWQKYGNIAVGVGVFFFLVSLYFERAGLFSFFSARSTRYGLNSLVMIILVLSIVVLANWIISRHPWKYDSTKNKQFTLSSLTINTLKDLKVPVKISAFFTESSLPNEPDAPERRQRMQDLLNNYRLYSKNLNIELIDPLKNKLLVDQYEISQNGTTILELGKQKTNVKTVEEEDLTNAILRVTSKKETTIYFLQGHQETSISEVNDTGFSAISDELKKSNYAIKEVNDFAAKPKVPEDCSVLVIADPRVTLLDPEIKGIKEYLAAGGRAMVLDDTRSDPSLLKILADYGLQTENNIVVDDQRFLASPAVPLIIPKAGTSVTKEFNMPMFFPASRSLTYKESQGGKVTFTPFAESADTSWGETDKERAVYDEGKDKKGPLTVGLLLSQPVNAQSKKSNETRLAIFGDSDFARNAYLGVPGNERIFVNCIAWLSEQENLIHLPPRNTRNDVMILSNTQLNYIGLFLVILLPVAVLGTGITVWVRRKKL